jgi:predicted regulator of Ras-like GTPase activity (Roadblock/LC7/MglB family)
MEDLHKDGTRKIHLGEKQIEEIEKGLSELADYTKATLVLLADITGQLISKYGYVPNLNNTSLSALAAADFAATAEMAKLVGERSKFKLLFHEGENTNVYLSNVGMDYFIVVIFKATIPLGLIRLYTKKAIKKLLNAIESSDEESMQRAQELIDIEFSSLLEDALEQSFREVPPKKPKI